MRVCVPGLKYKRKKEDKKWKDKVGGGLGLGDPWAYGSGHGPWVDPSGLQTYNLVTYKAP